MKCESQSPQDANANGEARKGASSAPANTLPKDGGAVRDSGEQFAANPSREPLRCLCQSRLRQLRVLGWPQEFSPAIPDSPFQAEPDARRCCSAILRLCGALSDSGSQCQEKRRFGFRLGAQRVCIPRTKPAAGFRNETHRLGSVARELPRGKRKKCRTF